LSEPADAPVDYTAIEPSAVCSGPDCFDPGLDSPADNRAYEQINNHGKKVEKAEPRFFIQA